MGTEVVFVDQMVAKGAIGGVMAEAIVAAVDAGYGAELDMVRPFVPAGEDNVAEGARICWWSRKVI